MERTKNKKLNQQIFKSVRFIDKIGVITPRALSENEGTSKAAISQWLKPMIDKGVLIWCDEKGFGFMGVADLEKAKRSGRAYLRVSDKCCLPTAYQLTGDTRWFKGGKLRKFYDLGIEESDRYGVESTILSDMVTENFNGEKSVPPDADGAVKVLSEKSWPDKNFQNDSLDSELVPAGIDNFADEFRGLLQMN